MSKRKNSIMQRRKPGSLLATGAGTLLGTVAGLAGGWIIYSNTAIDHQMPLPKALQANRELFFSEAAGRLSYYVDRHAAGRPLVLLHSINAAASAFEMSPLFEAFRSQRPVYALDLPGYGFSERSPRHYTPQLFADAVGEFLATQVKEPADVIALSLTSEFAARAALEEPQRFHSLTLISPSGLSERKDREGSQKLSDDGKTFGVHKWLSFPLWSQPLFDLIASLPSIRYFLGQSFVGTPPEDLVHYSYATSHQPGARFVPLYFLSGVLFTPDAKQHLYEPLAVPTLILYDQDPFVRFEQLPSLVQGSEWIEAVRIVNTLGLPHFEKTQETVDALNHFWDSLPNS